MAWPREEEGRLTEVQTEDHDDHEETESLGEASLTRRVCRAPFSKVHVSGEHAEDGYFRSFT